MLWTALTVVVGVVTLLARPLIASSFNDRATRLTRPVSITRLRRWALPSCCTIRFVVRRLLSQHIDAVIARTGRAHRCTGG